jgi:hypothetical protein
MKIPRWSMDTGGGWLVVAGLLGLLGLARPTPAAEFACAAGDLACLIDAINAANVTGAANTLTLAAGLYTLTAVDNNTDGPTGLPSISSTLTIRGAGADATILERAASAPAFGLLHIEATGTLTLEGLTLRGGREVGFLSGGIANQGTVTILNSTLSGNMSLGGGGGGIYNGGAVTIVNSTLSGNVASLGGGGILNSNQGTVTIVNSTLSGNTTFSFTGGNPGGGGIYNGGMVTMINSTLSGNVAAPDGGGGGISNQGTVTIVNSTLSGNMGFNGGGIRSFGTIFGTVPLVALQNTILAGNEAATGPDCAGPVTSLGTNLIGDPTDCAITLQASDLTGGPGLGALTDDGTPGQGYVPLLPESPAIDAGDPAACPATDQLGQLRVTPCDIGAIEFSPVTLTLGLNQATFRPGDTLRVRLGVHTPGPTVTADAYLGVLLPDGVTVFFVTSLAPLDGVVTRLDADPRTFAPLAASYDFPPGFDVTQEDFFVYTFTGGESAGAYAIFTLLTPPRAFADGQVDAEDLLGLTLRPFTVSP